MGPERRGRQGHEAVSRESRDPFAGRVLDGRYELLERIARGGMASVYAATDRRLDRTVAVKIMHPGLGDDTEFAARFVGEARAAARLSHPHVVSVYDQGEDDGVVFLAMELVRGHTLREAITQRSPMSPSHALALLTPVVGALAAAHQAGLIHRDVKPENVLISADGRVKVADFGLAKAMTSMTQHTATGMLIGTVAYVAPEIVTDGRSDARGDVYAVGVVLYELLTGRKPHAGESPIQVAYRHVHHDVPPPSDVVSGIPPYVDALVARATARDPGLRPADARVLAHQLELVRQSLASGVVDDPVLTADLHPRRQVGQDTEEMTAPPVPLIDEQPEIAARVVDEDPWQHSALEAMFAAAPASTPTQASTPTRRVERTQPRRVPTGTAAVTTARPQAPRRTPPGRPPAPAPRQRRSRKGALLLVLALLIAGAVGAGAWWFGYARYTSTPGVLGLAQADAETRLDASGLDGAVAERRYSDTVPVGDIIASDPAPGTRALDGSAVDLVVSLGVEEYDVPATVGMSEDEAQDTIAASNLTFGTSTAAFSETVLKGTVINSTPKAGKTVRPDTAVDLVVSKGREPLKVGDWAGRSADTASTMLERRGLVADASAEVYSASVPAGRVVSQQPAGDTTLFRGETVRLTVSLGPQLVTVPDGLVASGVDAATQALEAAGLVAEVRNSDAYVGLGYVLSISPDSGDEVPLGSTVVLNLV